MYNEIPATICKFKKKLLSKKRKT